MAVFSTVAYIIAYGFFGYGCYLVGWYQRSLKEIKEFKQISAIKDDYIQQLEEHVKRYSKLVDDMSVELKYREIKIKELSEHD